MISYQRLAKKKKEQKKEHFIVNMFDTKIFPLYNILDSLVVRISACHVEGPGSIPGRGELSFIKEILCYINIGLFELFLTNRKRNMS